MHKQASGYLPTPEEIKQECERIRATWSDRERQRRAGASDRNEAVVAWSPPSFGPSELRVSEDAGREG